MSSLLGKIGPVSQFHSDRQVWLPSDTFKWCCGREPGVQASTPADKALKWATYDYELRCSQISLISHGHPTKAVT